MASPHHHCHQPTPIPTATSTYTTCYCATTSPSIDPHLLQSIISLVQASSQNPSPNSYCHCDPHSNRRHTRHQIPSKDPIFSPHNSPLQRDVLVSLVNRIDALEASLRRRESYMCGSSVVREAAARVIQLHFRAYLVGRSRSLRHLKDLAFIKSKFNALKSSVSDQSRFDPVVVSRRTVELLYKVDSIQDRDPMIVNGKKSLTVDLVGFLDYVDAIVVKRRGVLARAVKKVSVFQTQSDRVIPWGLESDLRGVGRDRRVGIETLRGLYEDVLEVSSEEEISYESPRVMNKKIAEIGKGNLGGKRKPQAGVKKNVSFADYGRNRNVISICEPSSNPITDRNSTGDVKGILESLKKRVEEMEAGLASGVQDDEDEESESGVSAQTVDGENHGTTSAINTNQKTMHQHPRDNDDDDNEFTFPSPEHLKMDTKVDPMNKNLKIKS